MMGEPKPGLRFSKDKVHAVFKDYLHELRAELNRQKPGSSCRFEFSCRIDSVEELYRRLELEKV